MKPEHTLGDRYPSLLAAAIVMVGLAAIEVAMWLGVARLHAGWLWGIMVFPMGSMNFLALFWSRREAQRRVPVILYNLLVFLAYYVALVDVIRTLRNGRGCLSAIVLPASVSYLGIFVFAALIALDYAMRRKRRKAASTTKDFIMEKNMFQPELESMSRDQIAAMQLDRLKNLVKYVHGNNALYRERFEAAGVGPDDIKSLDDIRRLPTISKEDLRLSYPKGFLCVNPENIREMHMSSGSTGTPIAMLYTQNDLDQWADCMARCYVMAGCRAGDPIQITPSFGLFNGGFGMYHGARKAGLFIIPTGAGNTARQLKLVNDFGTRVITGVVSYGIRILEEMRKNPEVKYPSMQLGIFGAETFTNSMKKNLQEGLGIEAFDVYGMTETGGVGTLGQDCPDHSGLHVWEDHYIVEVLNRETRTPVPDGEIGELYITALTREALPVIRFRTGDLTRVLSRGKCACGRTHARIASITGRVDDMLIIKGINFFPSQVEQALMEIPGVLPNYQIIIEECHGVKDVRINVETDGSVTGFTVEKHLKERLGFSPKGDVFPAGGLPRQEGKAKRVFYNNLD